MGYSRVIIIGIILGCASELTLATSPPRIICTDARYSPCKCTQSTQWADDVESLTCDDGTALDRIQEVLKKVKSDGGKRIYITIKDGELTSMPQKYLGDAPVTGLTLQAPKLKSVDENAFMGQESSLQSLTFNGCSLPSIPAKSMSKLNNLKYIVFKDSKVSIEHVTKDTFAGLTNAAQVSQLTLDNIGIKTIGKESFSSFTSLVYLYLNNNELEELRSNSLTTQKLSLLELDGNKFKRIPLNLLGKVTKEGTLNLRSNNIVSLSSRAISASLKAGVHINVYANKVNCDCKFKALAEYLSQHPYGNRIHGECLLPENLKEKDFFDLKVTDFPNC